MNFRSKTPSTLKTNTKTLSLDALSSFYINHRGELISQAKHILGSSVQAEEVVQDAFIRILLAAPELRSPDLIENYVRKTVTNLSRDVMRREGKRPRLVLLEDSLAETEESLAISSDYVDQLEKADDAAVIRLALSRLSAAERTAIVMWELEGRSTDEVANILGIKKSNVRHAVSRARSSMRKVLTELVLDEESGLTALDLLSRSSRQVIEVSKKSSKVALSVLILLAGFVFTSGLGSKETFSVNAPLALDSANQNNSSTGKQISSSFGDNTNSIHTNSQKLDRNAKKSMATSSIRSVPLKFRGLDKNGIPLGFTVSDFQGNLGELFVSSRASSTTSDELSLTSSQILRTQSGAAKVLLTQSWDFSNIESLYTPILAVGQNGKWIPLLTEVSSVESIRMREGNYLYTISIVVRGAVSSSFQIDSSSGGIELPTLPQLLLVRAVFDPSKSQLLSEALYISEGSKT